MPMKTKPISVGFVSLGCAKNLVDLQVMGGELHLAGFEIGVDPEKADAVLINTCAFIEEAREEAVSNILAICELKKTGKCKAVIVSGCLAQRYREKLLQACPDVDAVLGLDDLERVPEVIREAVGKSASAKGVKGGNAKIVAVSADSPSHLYNPGIPGLVLTGGPYAYLKIAEGCFHVCAFCAIPGIRGKLRSRTIPDIVAEAKSILAEGITELDVIAQDVTSYGRDLKDGTTLVTLLRELDSLEGEYWIRLLYAHPAMLTDELLDFINGSRHVCHYLDVPIQHSHPDILRSMRRADTMDVVPVMADRIRARIPDVTLRTTCLVGFPGETEEHFQHLMDFIGKVKFDHLGAFAFSPEQGTPAFDMGDDPADVVSEDRRRRLIEKQAGIAADKLRGRVGTVTRVLLEEPPETKGDLWEGRAESQAPDGIDGSTYISGVPKHVKTGDFIDAEIVGVDEFDLRCVFKKAL